MSDGHHDNGPFLQFPLIENIELNILDRSLELFGYFTLTVSIAVANILDSSSGQPLKCLFSCRWVVKMVLDYIWLVGTNQMQEKRSKKVKSTEHKVAASSSLSAEHCAFTENLHLANRVQRTFSEQNNWKRFILYFFQGKIMKIKMRKTTTSLEFLISFQMTTTTRSIDRSIGCSSETNLSFSAVGLLQSSSLQLQHNLQGEHDINHCPSTRCP